MEIKSIITQLFFVGIVVVFCSDFLWLFFFFFKVLLQFFLLVYLFVFVVSFKLL